MNPSDFKRQVPPYIPEDSDLRYVQSLVQSIEHGGETPNPASIESGVTRTVTLTQQEFTQVLSALMTGADIIYPDNSHSVVWSFLKAFEI